MKYCSKCGAQMDDMTIQCPACGADMGQNSIVQAETSTIGILSIVFAILGGWLGLVLGIIGLCTYKLPENRKRCKIGIGIVIAEIVFAILLVIIIFAIGASQIA